MSIVYRQQESSGAHGRDLSHAVCFFGQITRELHVDLRNTQQMRPAGAKKGPSHRAKKSATATMTMPTPFNKTQEHLEIQENPGTSNDSWASLASRQRIVSQAEEVNTRAAARQPAAAVLPETAMALSRETHTPTPSPSPSPSPSPKQNHISRITARKQTMYWAVGTQGYRLGVRTQKRPKSRR